MKNFIVALGPIVVVTPERNMRLPMANKARSKKRKTPRVVKPHPNAISPMPISIIIRVLSLMRDIICVVSVIMVRQNGETGSEKRMMINLSSFSRL